MKRSLYLLLLIFTLTVAAQAQQQQKFDYEKFKADMTQFIVAEAGLSAAQVQNFRPVQDAMLAQKRILFRKVRDAKRATYRTAQEYTAAIRNIDRWEQEMKALEASYHNNLLRILPADKVFLILKAESKFHKQAFRRAAKK